MSKSRKKSKGIQTKHNDIVLANLQLLHSLEKLLVQNPITENELKRMTKTCWACGIESKEQMTRAHVIPKTTEGLDEPMNFLLLCDICHVEQPDGMPRQVQEEWLRSREGWYVRTVKLWDGWMEEFKEKYGGEPEEYVAAKHYQIKKLLKQGYTSAAGWNNGRANVYALLKESYWEWRGVKQVYEHQNNVTEP
jgi:hypothetical protein